MCAPWFQVKDQFKKNEIIALSSNFGLNADMSNRVGNILALFSPRREVYSIDESFLDLSGFGSKDLTRYGKEIKQTILQWTGLPVCIGIGSTKTLAMLANHCAKKRPQYAGVCNFNTLTPQAVDQILGSLPVNESGGSVYAWRPN